MVLKILEPSITAMKYFKALISQMVFIGMKTNLNISSRKTKLTGSNNVNFFVLPKIKIY